MLWHEIDPISVAARLAIYSLHCPPSTRPTTRTSKREPSLVRAHVPLFGWSPPWTIETWQCIPPSNIVSPLPFRWCAVFEQFGRLGQLGLISTLNVFRIKDCVIDSEAHLPAIHRRYKIVSFASAVKTVAETMVGVEPH